MFDVGATRRRVTIMSDRDMAFEFVDELLVEYLRDKSHSLVKRYRITVGCCDARTFLSAMLERIESEE